MHPAFAASDPDARPIWLASTDTWDTVRHELNESQRAFALHAGFEPRPGNHLFLSEGHGQLGGIVFGVDAEDATAPDRLIAGRLPGLLPEGTYRFATPPAEPDLATLAFALGGYRFARYRKTEAPSVRLVPPAGVDAAEVSVVASAIARARDLVNTPANDLGPEELEQAIREVGAAHGASVMSTIGADLIAGGFPLVHAVGKGSARAPRVVDLTWGDPKRPRVTLVGKGVCFDTGGLDIKPAAAMAIMKKDMGGAACALAVAEIVMARGLPVRLRLIVPAVENSISGRAFRPGDVYPSRKGLTVEIGDTDAEGRLVLADALALAAEEDPALLFDFATLTGSARVALGPDIPPFYTDGDDLAADIARHAHAAADPVWRMPLWRPYAKGLESKIADLGSIAGGTFAGSITAALFLARFVEAPGRWAHFDVYAWNPTARSARPEGGEAQAVRAVYGLLRERFVR